MTKMIYVVAIAILGMLTTSVATLVIMPNTSFLFGIILLAGTVLTVLGIMIVLFKVKPRPRAERNLRETPKKEMGLRIKKEKRIPLRKIVVNLLLFPLSVKDGLLNKLIRKKEIIKINLNKIINELKNENTDLESVIGLLKSYLKQDITKNERKTIQEIFQGIKNGQLKIAAEYGEIAFLLTMKKESELSKDKALLLREISKNEESAAVFRAETVSNLAVSKIINNITKGIISPQNNGKRNDLLRFNLLFGDSSKLFPFAINLPSISNVCKDELSVIEERAKELLNRTGISDVEKRINSTPTEVICEEV